MKAKLLLPDADTGVDHKTTVEVREFAPSRVCVTFGNSFSIDLEFEDADELATTIKLAVAKVVGDEPGANDEETW